MYIYTQVQNIMSEFSMVGAVVGIIAW